MFSFINMIVGGACYPASAAFLTDKPNSAFDEFKAGAVGKTAMYCEEPDKNKQVYLNNLKEFTGGGMLTAAAKYGHNMQFPNFGALFIGANTQSLPQFDPTEQGIVERLVAFPCKAKFCANPRPGTNERSENPRLKNLFLNPGSDEAKAMITETHRVLIDHMRTSFKPEILDANLGRLPLGPIVTQETNEIVAQGNTVLAFLMDPDCPFELVNDDTAMAPYKFFEEDWKDNADWADKYKFPDGPAARASKEFKKQMVQIDRGATARAPAGVKVTYSDGKIRSALWGGAQLQPYIGVRRKNQPMVVV